MSIHYHGWLDVVGVASIVLAGHCALSEAGVRVKNRTVQHGSIDGAISRYHSSSESANPPCEFPSCFAAPHNIS